jgi:hypothetical protein
MQQQQQQTGQQMQTGQQVMSEPPSVISTKDLNYLRDAMSWELVAMKKCHHFAQECQDQQIKKEIDKTGQMHQKHYQTLLKHVDPKKSINNM